MDNLKKLKAHTQTLIKSVENGGIKRIHLNIILSQSGAINALEDALERLERFTKEVEGVKEQETISIGCRCNHNNSRTTNRA